MELLGIKINEEKKEVILKKIEEFIRERKPHYIITLNTFGFTLAQKDEEFKNIVNSADIVIPDGAGIIFAAKFLKNLKLERIAGIDLICDLFKISKYKYWSFYFLGAKREVINKCVENLKKDYPYLKILGARDGYFKEEEEKEIVKDIREKKPDILLAGMGMPKQEKFIYRYKKELDVPVCIGVGGSFDVLAGVVKRAPKIFQKIGAEWLYRTIQEPKRFKRISCIPEFLFLILRSKK
jgi:N-acetylglucosaminyldiphosphoundecaprenol N-acetyl-beta-D-mannosaminyltransferase